MTHSEHGHHETPLSSGVSVRVASLTRRFEFGKGHLQALGGIDAEIKAGEYVAITGPSGSGKSTFLRAVGGLDRGFEGEIFLNGTAISPMRDRQLSLLRARRLGFVFQSFHLLPQLTVLENVLLPTYFHTLSPLEEQRHRAHELLQAVGLEGREQVPPETLSGGQQQRVAIARALLNKPDLLLCDEPTGSLDVETGIAVMELLERERHDRGATLLVVTHEAHILQRAERAIQLVDGKLAWSGPPDKLPHAIPTEATVPGSPATSTEAG